MNWTITDGDIYVSKNGNDTTGDGSMSLPYASINKGFIETPLNGKVIIGTGLWQESVTQKDIHVIGDGEVVFDGSNPLAYFKMSVGWSGTINWKFSNIKFRNYYAVYAIYGDFATGLSSIEINNCELSYYALFLARTAVNIIINNSLFYKPATVRKCYFENSTVIEPATYTPITITNSNYIGGIIDTNAVVTTFSNCFKSIFNWNGTIIGDGSLPINNNAVVNCIALDPKFNNESIYDYTLQPDSPCLFAGKNNSHIGAYEVGYNFTANSSEFTEEGGATFSQSDVGSGVENDIVKTSQTINGVTTRYFILNTDHTEGTIESEWIDFQTLYELNSAKLFANFIYDEDGVATSRVDIDNNDTGEFPNQYDFEMKTALDEDDKDTATWQETIWNKELSNVSARFVKLKIYMKG